jgi:hypothetical protein
MIGMQLFLVGFLMFFNLAWRPYSPPILMLFLTGLATVVIHWKGGIENIFNKNQGLQGQNDQSMKPSHIKEG